MYTTTTATLFLIITFVASLRAQYQSPNIHIDDPNPVGTSYQIYESEIRPYCVERTSGNPNVFSSGQSVENFIALVERLELLIANDTDNSLRQHIGPEAVAKLLLRRFRYDGFTPDQGGGAPQINRDNVLTDMAMAVLTPTTPSQLPTDYAFPNKFFTQSELCSLYNMLSHSLYDTNYNHRVSYSEGFRVRAKRQTYQQNRNNRQNIGNQYNRQFADTNPYTASPYLPSRSTLPIKEEGVVSFRSSKEEAIQISRTLLGVIAGLSTDVKNKAKDVMFSLRPNYVLPADYDKDIDPVTMVTLADLYAVATSPKDSHFGLTGEWTDNGCTNYYGIRIDSTEFNSSRNFIQATRAEIRGGIDGYKIGKALQNMGSTDLGKLRLSAILHAYYSKPQASGSSSAFTVSYCDRNTNLNIQDIENQANIYGGILAKYKGLTLPLNLNQDFKKAFSEAQATITTGYNNYCTKPGGQLDESAPCETPSDVLYFIDGTSQQKLQNSANIVAQLDGNLNFCHEGGTVSIFFNSQQKSNPNPEVHPLPIGTGQDQWPLTSAVFNSSNAGYSQCRINDFNTTLPQAVANTGKLFRYLNATLFDYHWWSPRTNQSWLPAKSAVLIDFDSVPVAPNDGQDRNDYNWFKDQLRSRHRDVLFLSLANNQELFKDILRNQDTDKASPNDIQNSAPTLARKICENPATFQYTMCHQTASNGVQMTGYITPGYKQNWAMYPEYFLKSFNIKFSFKAEDGNIRVCFDRTFPPRRQDWCIESSNNPQMDFEISNPCKGRSFESCDPFYFTVWGKDKTNPAQCLDPRCQNLNQIRWTVTHTGVQCSSSLHLLPNTSFQLISMTLFAILYLFLSK